MSWTRSGWGQRFSSTLCFQTCRIIITKTKIWFSELQISLSLWLNVSLPLHNNSLRTTTDAACSTRVTSQLPGRWGFLAQRVMWLAEPGKELLKWVKAVKCLRGGCVCVCVIVHLEGDKTDSVFPTARTVLFSEARVIIKTMVFAASAHCLWFLLPVSLSHILPSLGWFINFPLPPDVWMYPICPCWDHGGQHWPQMAVLWNALLGFKLEKT